MHLVLALISKIICAKMDTLIETLTILSTLANFLFYLFVVVLNDVDY
jgi:hypothetical protein